MVPTFFHCFIHDKAHRLTPAYVSCALHADRLRQMATGIETVLISASVVVVCICETETGKSHQLVLKE